MSSEPSLAPAPLYHAGDIDDAALIEAVDFFVKAHTPVPSVDNKLDRLGANAIVTMWRSSRDPGSYVGKFGGMKIGTHGTPMQLVPNTSGAGGDYLLQIEAIHEVGSRMAPIRVERSWHTLAVMTRDTSVKNRLVGTFNFSPIEAVPMVKKTSNDTDLVIRFCASIPVTPLTTTSEKRVLENADDAPGFKRQRVENEDVL